MIASDTSVVPLQHGVSTAPGDDDGNAAMSAAFATAMLHMLRNSPWLDSHYAMRSDAVTLTRGPETSKRALYYVSVGVTSTHAARHVRSRNPHSARANTVEQNARR
jgi:hypothetical protein